MAFQAPNLGQENKNRKILEQLEEDKKRLRLQHSHPPSTGTSGPSAPSVVPVQAPFTPSTDSLPMTPAQRAAIQHAHANSVGYFITQDSSFGNLILPVLPRFDK